MFRSCEKENYDMIRTFIIAGYTLDYEVNTFSYLSIIRSPKAKNAGKTLDLEHHSQINLTGWGPYYVTFSCC